jgi:hypothetical protein
MDDEQPMKMSPSLAALVVLWGTTTGSAEPLSRADAIRRALGVNPEAQKSREDINKLRGLEKEALADALPEVNVFATPTRRWGRRGSAYRPVNEAART